MAYLLDTNVVSDLVRNPQGRVVEHVRRVGEANVCTSVIAAAELRFGAEKKGSLRLTRQLQAVLGALESWSTWQGALAALVTTPVVSLALMRSLDNPTVPAALAGAIALVVVSLVTAGTRRDFNHVAEQLAHERLSIETPANSTEGGPALASAPGHEL